MTRETLDERQWLGGLPLQRRTHIQESRLSAQTQLFADLGIQKGVVPVLESTPGLESKK